MSFSEYSVSVSSHSAISLPCSVRMVSRFLEYR